MSSNFTGYISQVSLWNVAKSAAQIQQHMSQGIPTDTTGLVAGWLLNDSSPNSAIDYSSNKYNLKNPDTTTQSTWVQTNAQSLDRVQTGLNLIVSSPDGAYQN
jgi:hypothetical protein